MTREYRYENWLDENYDYLLKEYGEDFGDGSTSYSFSSYCKERFEDMEQFAVCDVLFDSNGNR